MQNNEERIEKIIKHHLPRWNELPEIDLYLDQVVNYLEKYLGILSSNDDDKIITKTMINNYVKQGIMPAPEKKKYGKTHIAYLMVICILKQVYSISEAKSRRYTTKCDFVICIKCTKPHFRQILILGVK